MSELIEMGVALAACFIGFGVLLIAFSKFTTKKTVVKTHPILDAAKEVRNDRSRNSEGG